ncbi:MAG: hypothetical protein C0609_07830 [Deltaproteobacteria bacterium]|nr:MAG: hypothetical protein C0609_07830 [Deltaproteobacteria bacterium]
MTDEMITRRRFLFSMGGTMLAFAGMNGRPMVGGTPYFNWAQLKYPGAWNPNPNAASRLLSEVRRRTSVECGVRVREIAPGASALYDNPFLYISGRGDFPDLGRDAARWLRRYVEAGGFIFIDDATGSDDSGFARGVSAFLAEAFPGEPLAPVSTESALFQSFYLLKSAPGRRVVRPIFTGIEREDLTPVLFSYNDLLGALDGDKLGGYTHPQLSGGERQRELSIRMCVNIILYALTGNYKKDQVHIPFILKRRKR